MSGIQAAKGLALAAAGAVASVIPVRWFQWRNLGSYETTTLITGSWVALNVITELPDSEDGNQGTDYGSGIMGNSSGRDVSGSLVIDASMATNGTSRSMDFAIGYWNGSSYVVDAANIVTKTINASTSSYLQGQQNIEFANVDVDNNSRYRVYVRRNAGTQNLRTAGYAARYVEYDAP